MVLSQLGPGGEGGDLPPTPDYLWLRRFLEEHPLRNGNEWLAEMMAQDHRGQMLGALGGRSWGSLPLRLLLCCKVVGSAGCDWILQAHAFLMMHERPRPKQCTWLRHLVPYCHTH